MPVTLTIKQVPDELAARLRALAARNHRSIQGELMHTLETLLATSAPAEAVGESASPNQDTAMDAQRSPAPTSDSLLAALDHIVAGTQWGKAPVLTREQANDRGLTREIDHLVQELRAEYQR